MYNKIEYWSNRNTPNSNDSLKNTESQIKWLSQFIDNKYKILEYGPGVLRLVDLYKNLVDINFYDITDKHKQIVENKCLSENIKINKFIIDNSGKVKTEFKDFEFDLIICSEVFIHSPDEEINELIIELARIGKKVIITTWYENGKYINKEYCWTRDYKKLLHENNMEILLWEENLFNNKQVGFVYKKKM